MTRCGVFECDGALRHVCGLAPGERGRHTCHVRVLGILLFMAGGLATGIAIWNLLVATRGRAAVAACGGVIAVATAVLGLVLFFVPGFL